MYLAVLVSTKRDTILSQHSLDCPNESIVSLETEMFGPVASLLTFKDEIQAIKMANNTKFGLGSGLFTNNLARAHRVSKKLSGYMLD